MKVRFVSGMDMLNLSRALARIMSGAASVSPVYTTILERVKGEIHQRLTNEQTWLQGSVFELRELHTIERVLPHRRHCNRGGKMLRRRSRYLGQLSPWLP